ncbi:MAG: YHS domain-containing protein [Alphaproteobacteria bacterium]|nr:YHS domain-containing protein [Alphaproteobacteria bacterium]
METVLYLLVWGLAIFLMMRFGCGSHAMGHGHGHSRSGKNEPASGDGDLRWVPPESAVDPVCGMTIPTAGARSAVHDGNVFYFCSAQCRDRFEAAPADFGKAPAAPSVKEHHHV